MKKILLFVLISFALCSCYHKNPETSTITSTETNAKTSTETSNANDTRCYLSDKPCQMNFFQTVARVYAKTGIKVIGVPIIDPYMLKEYVLSLLGFWFLKLIDGEVLGISNCVVTNFESNIEERYRQPEMICSKIIIRGRYSLTSAPIVGNTCSWCDVNGEGNGTIILEDWFFKFRYNFIFERRENKQIYMKAFFDKAVYESSVKKVTVQADSIKSGKRDITDYVLSCINNNWKTIWDSYVGQYFTDNSAKEYFYIYELFYERSPATTFLKDDLTKYLSNQSTTCYA